MPTAEVPSQGALYKAPHTAAASIHQQTLPPISSLHSFEFEPQSPPHYLASPIIPSPSLSIFEHAAGKPLHRHGRERERFRPAATSSCLVIGSAAAAMAANATKCPGQMKVTSQGAFQGENPLDYALPLAILQICLVVVVTRGLAYLLRPLRQPRVIAEIIVSSPIIPLSLHLPPPESNLYCLI